MFFSWRLIPFLTVLTIAGCRREAPRAFERVALLPMENLTGDHAYDWLARGGQTQLSRQLASSRSVAPVNYATSSSAAVGATRILHTTLEKRDRALRIEAILEDAVTHQQVGDRVALLVPPEQVLGGINELARWLAKDAAQPVPPKPAAMAAFVAAQSVTGQSAPGDARLAGLTQAASLDGTFAPPLMALAELHLSAGRKEEARAAIEAAATRALTPVEREQVALLRASANEDRPRQAEALAKLSAAAPLQADLQLFTATRLQALRQLGPAVESYERALRVEPNNRDLWNLLGYANGYLGRLPAARQAFARYQALSPAEPNVLDSQGEVNYMNGQFKEAGDFFAATFARAPQFEGGRAMMKAAYARLLAHQDDEADHAAAAYAKAAGPTPAAEVARIHWLFSRGKPSEAVDYVDQLVANAKGPLLGLYQSHRCGLLLSRNRAAAHASARAAVAASPSSPAIVCLFLSQPSASPAEWAARAEHSFQVPLFRRQALAYALFFDRHYTEAFPLIESLLLESGPDADSELRVWLAECQWRTGRWASAKETLARWPLPAADSIFAGRQVTQFVLATLKTGEHFDDNAIAKRWSPVGKTMRDSF
ncbi:MAG: tetratricopeptide repeat protein [Bryobacteraceae bacterium]|nr:tetratricopeptide repeat protein [Bryobacteraceae bacterium]